MNWYRTLEFSFLFVGAMSLSLGIPAECAFRYDLRKLLNSAETNLDQDDRRVVKQEWTPDGNWQAIMTSFEMGTSAWQLGVNRIHGPPP